MATANPAPGAWSATPFPSSITLYKAGQGWPTDFDQKKANDYYSKCTNKVSALIKDTIKKWNAAGFR
jgi:creatinine amidohydrolase